ncbi:unnamed protein product [Adineta steineri]|uniref:Uncharacterized protein n=1 Tax=Adineta steineri TaxID=433720 RepID=A0A819HGQ9_9BILA|nr:unnamed protein product [Adineta steineri]CAF3901632.1 unnamed protein product [Adineta steineri]
MQPLCAVDTCKRKCRGLCYCCGKNLCPDHFKEYDDRINSQVTPLGDQLNEIADKFSKIIVTDIIVHCREVLDKWRDDSHTAIDQFYQEKCKELEERCIQRVNDQQKQIDDTKVKINDLIREKEATYEDIPLLTTIVNDIERDVNQFKEEGIIIDTDPLIIDEDLIYIEEWSLDEVDLPNISFPYEEIDCSIYALASNNRFLLLIQNSNLCLFDRDLNHVKKCSWEHGIICDICWSSTLNIFILVTDKDGIFLVDENLTSIKSIETIEKKNWLSCTCSNSSLFVTTNSKGSNIFQFNVLSSFNLTKQWKPETSCGTQEYIYSIANNNETLAMMIANTTTKEVRIELRSSTTLDQLWSLYLYDTNKPSKLTSCVCLLRCDEWLVADPSGSRLFHITKDGKIKESLDDKSKPSNAVLFGSNTLAINTTKCVNFYRV